MAIFGNAPVAAEAPYPQVDTGSLERRVRSLEEGLTNLRKIVQVTEENILVKNRHMSTEFKTITSDLNELRRENQELKDKILLILKEMQSMARAEDVKIIERYVNMWNPVRFVTQGEIENLVEEILSKHKENEEPAPKEQDDGD